MRNLASLALAPALGLCLCFPALAHHEAEKAPLATSFASHHATGKLGMSHGEKTMAKVGDIMVINPMIRATPPVAPAAGGFVTLQNTGTTDDTLIAVRVAPEIAGKVELHDMKMDGDIMRMFEVEGGIPVPAGETVQLAPGGLHIMLMGLPQGFDEGAVHDMTLVFEKAGEVTLPFAVLPLSKVREMTGAGAGGHGGPGPHGARSGN